MKGLIGETRFFRDADAYEALAAQIGSSPLLERPTHQPIRVWVIGCGTGEEAYGVAIVFAEALAQLASPPPVQLFATDLDPDALAQARTGRFLHRIEADVSTERLRRFFEADGETHHRIRKEIRQTILFAPHDLLRDPPFSRLDWAICRDTLPAFDRVAQARALGLLHFGLRPGGTLWLGSAGSADAAAELFRAIDPRQGLFARVTGPGASSAHAVSSAMLGWQPPSLRADTPQPPATPSLGELHRLLVEEHAPPSVLVDEELCVLHLDERVGRYFSFVGGEPTRELLCLVSEDLRGGVRAALRAAKRSGRTSAARIAQTPSASGPRHLVVTARPVGAPNAAQTLFLVTFDEHDDAHATGPTDPSSPLTSGEPVLLELEAMLQRHRDDLRLAVEQHEITVEELRANNEELRATTEELQISKEEMRSVNDALSALTLDLQLEVEAAKSAHGDLENLMTATDIAVIFLDLGARLGRFTPRARDLYNVIPGDIGRPLAHLTHRLADQPVERWVEEVLATHTTVEHEIRSTTGMRYLAKVGPYRATSGGVEGVVLTFLDITRLRRAEADARERESILQLGERAAGVGSWTISADRETVSMSETCWRLHGFEGEPVRISLERWLSPFRRDDRRRLTGLLASAGHGADCEIELCLDGDDAPPRWLWLLGRVTHAPGEDDRITGVTVDVTSRRKHDPLRSF